MINIECTEQNQEEVVKIIEQALKGVDANITVMDEEITMLDVAQFISYNVKQQRVYLGRLEGRARELRGEMREVKEKMEPFFEIGQMMLEDMKRERSEKLRKEREEYAASSAGTTALSREEMSKLP